VDLVLLRGCRRADAVARAVDGSRVCGQSHDGSRDCPPLVSHATGFANSRISVINGPFAVSRSWKGWTPFARRARLLFPIVADVQQRGVVPPASLWVAADAVPVVPGYRSSGTPSPHAWRPAKASYWARRPVVGRGGRSHPPAVPDLLPGEDASRSAVTYGKECASCNEMAAGRAGAPVRCEACSIPSSGILVGATAGRARCW
jgi:hypothetical protein